MNSVSSSSTSPSLVERLRAYDAAAWERLCDIYGPLVYRWARIAGLQEDDAADIGQEVFRVVAQRIPEFQRTKQGTFRGWLWTITRNKIGDFIRRAGKERPGRGGSSALQQMSEIPFDPEVEEKASERTDSARIVLHRGLEAIRMEFEPSTWDAFWRATVEGHANADIADDLGMTRQAVRQAKYRVLRRLRSELKFDLP